MLDQLLAGYAAPEDRFDELLAAPGRPRPHWDAFVRALAERSEREVSDTLSLTERQIREHGITYNVYADAQGEHRPWEVDPIPLVLPADEWQTIAAGIEQRADLLNRVLGDLYGAQTLMKSGAIPPQVIFGHRGFLSPAEGLKPAGGRHLLQYAADLARSPDGRWWVVNDRTQAPSGSGYALENRLVVSRVFPQMFRELPVQHLASFFDALRTSLRHWAPRGDGPTRIVLLTPGPYNETYFEHALLARYLGFALVEGSDLTVRDDRVWLKTIAGLERVHAIVRRQDDDYCDPLELRSDSALGVPGLTDCARRGTVLLANALGSGVLESGALLGYLPRLSRELLGEPLQLPSIATWWLGEPAAFEDAWRRPERLIIKPIERSPNEPGIVVGQLSAEAREALRQAHRRAAAALRRAGVGPRLAGAGARGNDARLARRAHRRPARVRGGDAERLARHARRTDPRRRRRDVADHRDAARRPLEGHLGSFRRAGQRRVHPPLQHRDGRRSGQQRRDAAFARGREPVLVRSLRRALRRDRAGPARRPRRGPRGQRLACRHRAGVDARRAARHRREKPQRGTFAQARRDPSRRCASASAWRACRGSPSRCATGCRSTTGERSTA